MTSIASAVRPAHTVTRSVAVRLVQGSAIYGLANFSLKGLNFALILLYTRFLRPADYGTIALAETVAMVLATVSALGLDSAIRRLYFQYSDTPGVRSEYLGTMFGFGSLATLSMIALAFGLGPWLLPLLGPRVAVPFYPYIALAVGAAGASQLLDYRLGLYQTEGRAKAYALLTGASFLATASAVIALVVVTRHGAAGMLAGKLISAVIFACIAVHLLWPWLRRGFDWHFVRETLPLALPLVPHQFMALGLVVADRFILQRYRDLGEVGVYSLAYTLGMAMYLVTSSVMQAWSPLFFESAAREQGGLLCQLSTRLVVFLSSVAVVGILAAETFVNWFVSPQYRAAGKLVPIIIASYLLHALFSLFQLWVLQGKRTALIWAVSGTSLAANLALNFALIPRWGAQGAAYATLAAYGVEAMLIYVYARRVYRVDFSPRATVAAMAICGLALAVSQAGWGNWRAWVFLASFAGLQSMLWRVAGMTRSDAAQFFRQFRFRTDGNVV